MRATDVQAPGATLRRRPVWARIARGSGEMTSRGADVITVWTVPSAPTDTAPGPEVKEPSRPPRESSPLATVRLAPELASMRTTPPEKP